METNVLLFAAAASEAGISVWEMAGKTTHLRYKAFSRLGLAALAGLFLLTALPEGLFRYGGFLLLATVMGLFPLLVLWKKGEHSIPKPLRRIWLTAGSLLLIVTSLLPALLFPPYEPIPVTGEYAVGTALYTWIDDSRAETYGSGGEKRRVTVQFYYPEAEGRYPLVVYSHGVCSTVNANESTCRELASNGYTVAAVAHPYHAMFVRDADGRFTGVDSGFMQLAMSGPTTHSNAEMLSYYREWMAIETADMNFALDTILALSQQNEGGAFARIDPERIGLFGHSMGGAVCAATGRMRSDIDAVVVLEGMLLGELTGADEIGFTYGDDPYPLPLLDVNSDSIASRGMKQMFGSREYVNFHVVRRSADAREVTFRQAGHMNFCDLPVISPALAGWMGTGSRDPRDCIVRVNGLVRDYFDHYLKGAPLPEIAAEY